MKNKFISAVEAAGLKKEVAEFEIGDSVDVHQRILEGEKERTQVFSGLVISRKGDGMGEMFTVRRVVGGEGVERIFPLNSPKIAKVEVKRSGKVRRAKLYYLATASARKRPASRERKKKVKIVVPGTPSVPSANPTSPPAAE